MLKMAPRVPRLLTSLLCNASPLCCNQLLCSWSEVKAFYVVPKEAMLVAAYLLSEHAANSLLTAGHSKM